MKSSFLLVSVFAFGLIFSKCNNSTSYAINEVTVPSTFFNFNSTIGSLETQILRTNTTEFIAQSTHPKSNVFEELICHSELFIDNSLLIHYLFRNNRTLVTLPRAFGKTTSLQMLKTFFQIEINETTGEKLKLEETQSFKIFLKRETSCGNRTVNLQNDFLITDGNYSDVMKLMGAKPVIHLDLYVSGPSETLQDVENSLRNRLKSSILEHVYIKHNSATQYEAHHHKYDDLLEQLSSSGVADMSKILPSLAKILADIFNETVIVLINEYDTLLNKIVDISNSDQKQKKNAILHISSIYKSLINTESIQYVFMVGTYYWADPEILPELDQFALNTAAGGKAINFYGFGDNQVETIFKEMNLEQYLTEVKSRYKGYDFGATKELMKYNPHSISTVSKTKQIGSHWTSIENTSTMLTKHLVKYVNFNKMLYQVLIGGYIPIPINRSKQNSTPVVSFTFDDFCRLSSAIKNVSLLDKIEWYSKHNNESTIGFRVMFATGYLTRVRETESLHHINLPHTILTKIANLEIEKYLWSQYGFSLGIPMADAEDRTNQLYEASMSFHTILVQLIRTNCTNGKQFAIELKKLMRVYPPLGMQTPGPALHYNERIIESLIEAHILSSVYKLDFISREIRPMFNWANPKRPDVVLITREKRMVIIELKCSNLMTPNETMNETKQYATWYLDKRNEITYGHILEFKLVTIIVRRTLKRRIEINVEILPRSDIENIVSTSARNQYRWIIS